VDPGRQAINCFVELATCVPEIGAERHLSKITGKLVVGDGQLSKESIARGDRSGQSFVRCGQGGAGGRRPRPR